MANAEDSQAKSAPMHNPNPTKFASQVIIITGSASGIGRQTAEYFAAQGATLILLDINETGLTEVQTVIQNSGGKASIRRCDITQENEVNDSVASIAATHGKIDVLVNLAGIYSFQPLTQFSTELYQRHIAINVNGSFFLTRAVLPYMQKAGYGRIIHTSSTTYADPKPGLSAYVMSKAAVLGLVRSAAVEAGPGVTVNAIMPGLIDTDQMKSVAGFEAIQEMCIERQAVKQQGTAIDVAHAIGFIASPEAAFFSGQVFNCSGGETFSW